MEDAICNWDMPGGMSSGPTPYRDPARLAKVQNANKLANRCWISPGRRLRRLRISRCLPMTRTAQQSLACSSATAMHLTMQTVASVLGSLDISSTVRRHACRPGQSWIPNTNAGHCACGFQTMASRLPRRSASVPSLRPLGELDVAPKGRRGMLSLVFQCFNPFRIPVDEYTTDVYRLHHDFLPQARPADGFV